MSGIECPTCGSPSDAATEPLDSSATPREGDISICLYCRSASVFTGQGLDRRAPTDAELVEILSHPDVARYANAAQRVMRHARAGEN